MFDDFKGSPKQVSEVLDTYIDKVHKLDPPGDQNTLFEVPAIGKERLLYESVEEIKLKQEQKLDSTYQNIKDDISELIKGGEDLAAKTETKIQDSINSRSFAKKLPPGLSAAEYQRWHQNPRHVKTFSELRKEFKVKGGEQGIDIADELVSVKAQLKDVEVTKPVLKDTLHRLMHAYSKGDATYKAKNGDVITITKSKTKAGNDSIAAEIQYADGTKEKISISTQQKDSLSAEGKAKRAKLREQLSVEQLAENKRLGIEPEAKTKDDDVLRVQVARQGKQLANVSSITDIDEAMSQFLKYHQLEKNLEYVEAKLKDDFMGNVAPLLPDSGLRLKFSDSKKAATLEVTKGRQNIELSKAREQQLADYEGQLKQEGMTEVSTQTTPRVTANVDKKATNAKLDQKLASHLEQRAQARKGEEFLDSKNPSTKLEDIENATAYLVKEARKQKKAGKASGRLFALDPLVGAALVAGLLKVLKKAVGNANVDLIVAAAQIRSKGKFSFQNTLRWLADKTGDPQKVKMAGTAGELMDLEMGTTQSINTRFKRSKNPVIKQFLGKYQEDLDRLFAARRLMQQKLAVNPKLREQLDFLELRYKTHQELREALDRGKLAELDRRILETSLSIGELKSRLTRLSDDTIDTLKKERDALADSGGKTNDQMQAIDDIEALKTHLNSRSAEAGDAFWNGLKAWSYATALRGRATIALLTYFDPAAKSLALGSNPFRALSAQTTLLFDKKFRDSELFKAHNSVDKGHQFEARQAKDIYKKQSKLDKAVEKVGKAIKATDIFEHSVNFN